MKKIILTIMVLVLSALFSGCGSDSYTSAESVTPNNEVIVLDNNQTMGYVPSDETNVQILNLGDGANYLLIKCE